MKIMLWTSKENDFQNVGGNSELEYFELAILYKVEKNIGELWTIKAFENF